MVLKAVLLAALTSAISIGIHITISVCRKGRRGGEHLIFELIRQTKLLLFIWLILFLFYSTFFFLPLKSTKQIFEYFSHFEKNLDFFYGIFFYFALCFIYLSFYYFVDRSISSTLLEIIYASPKKKLTIEEVKRFYDVEAKYETELKGMIEGRFIIKEGIYYRNSFKGRLYARIAYFIKNFFKLGSGG